MTNRGIGSISNLLSRIKSDTIVTDFIDSLKDDILSSSKGSKTSPFFTPSGMVCKRQMFYKARQTPTEDVRDNSYNLVGMAESGTDRHLRLQNHIKNLKQFEYCDVGEYIANNNLNHLTVLSFENNEWKIEDKDTNLHFMLDGIIYSKMTNKYYILEIKTEISFKHNKRVGVEEVHKHQAIAYTQELNIPNVLFLYENRDNLDILGYLYSPTQEEIQEYWTNKLNFVNYALKEDMLPERVKATDISLDGECNTLKICKYCKYTKKCDRNEK